MQQLTGFMGYLTQMGYATSITDGEIGQYVPFIMGFSMVLAAFFAIKFYPKADKVKNLLIGNFAMSLCTYGIAICFIFIKKHSLVVWGLVVLIIIFMAVNGALIIPSLWPYVGSIGTKS
jgi:hypothetical protein